jgi:hypothetical protein
MMVNLLDDSNFHRQTAVTTRLIEMIVNYLKVLRDFGLDKGGVDPFSPKYRLSSIICDVASFRLFKPVRSELIILKLCFQLMCWGFLNLGPWEITFRRLSCWMIFRSPVITCPDGLYWNKYVIVPADKDSNNIVFVCKSY